MQTATMSSALSLPSMIINKDTFVSECLASAPIALSASAFSTCLKADLEGRIPIICLVIAGWQIRSIRRDATPSACKVSNLIYTINKLLSIEIVWDQDGPWNLVVCSTRVNPVLAIAKGMR